LLTWEIYCTK